MWVYMVMTEERLQEIRHENVMEGGDPIKTELLEEIRRLKSEIKKSTYMEDMHRADCRMGIALEKERDELKAENQKCLDFIREKQQHNKLLMETCDALKAENEKLKERIQNLKQALTFWLSSTPTNQDGKYNEFDHWHAARAFEVLQEDDKLEAGK